jgi:diaminopimelate decarboxylase
MAAGIASRATLIMESLAQVSTLESILSRIRPLPVVLRLNAAGLAGELRAAAGGDHFGLDVQDALTAVARLRALGIPVRGLHVFAGSYSFKNSSPRILEAMQRLLPSVELAAGTPLQFVNLGGGFPHDWQDHTPWFDDYRRAMAPLSQRIQLYHESGRAVFANGGSFVTKIVAVKTINGRRVAICDGGMAHCFMLAQTEKVLKRFQHPLVVSMHEGAAGSVQGRVQIVGNSCNRMDVIGELDCGVAVDVGDRLVFAGCGSYSTYSPTGFLSLKAAVRYLIS